jgi:Zn-dependent protease with chaperone function
MEHSEYVRLVRLSEQESEKDSARYRRRVAAFAALGYAWVLGCLVLAASMLGFVATLIQRGQFKFAYAGLFLAAGGLLCVSMRALWCRLEAPDGLKLTSAEVPALFEALERIRKKVRGPALDAVYLDGDFNASITQLPRFGLVGGSRNYLTIGMPMLMALDKPRLLAVLAHEYGHLRGDHGRFAAWIYRTRQSWSSLNDSFRGETGPVAAATQAFLRWYFPRFTARTFALARQDEYEADRIAGRLLGPATAGGALVEIAVKSDWLHRRFWPEHWAAAAGHPTPVGPYAPMAKLLALPPEPEFAADSLRAALRRISDLQDTHPGLRDRLDSLQVPRTLPTFSKTTALSLLGAHAPRCIAHFDHQWCRESATEWKEHHAYLGRVRTRCAELGQRGQLQPDERVELGGLFQRLGQGAAARSHYTQALAQSPGHPAALRGLIQVLPQAEVAQHLLHLEELFQVSRNDRWWACARAIARLELTPYDDGAQAALKKWRERQREAGEAEQRAWEELMDGPPDQQVAPHDLGPFERGELAIELRRWEPVERAWLLRKHLKEFPWRRCYVLLVSASALDEEDAQELCDRLRPALDLPGAVRVAIVAARTSLPRLAGEPVFER